jgi:transcription initiation factor TFIIIB Brf1 subunit/transcription initiation factor TFIIB
MTNNIDNIYIDNNIDIAWDDFYKSEYQEDNTNQQNNTINLSVCKKCNSDNLYEDKDEIVCNNCGLIQEIFYSNTSFSQINNNTTIPSTKNTFANSNSRLAKILKWQMWSNEEKNNYKLKTYVKNICDKLNIQDDLLSVIYETVLKILTAIKENEGTKRARVKDGIIVVCIQYVCKNTEYNLNSSNLAKKLNLDIKYITKAEKMILELMNGKKLLINKENFLSTEDPYYYIDNIIRKKQINIPNQILNKVKQLIKLCEENDILLDHTPLSIGVCCFYYILNLYSIKIDTQLFSEIYNLSIVTINKTINKLKTHNEFISKHLI